MIYTNFRNGIYKVSNTTSDLWENHDVTLFGLDIGAVPRIIEFNDIETFLEWFNIQSGFLNVCIFYGNLKKYQNNYKI